MREQSIKEFAAENGRYVITFPSGYRSATDYYMVALATVHEPAHRGIICTDTKTGRRLK